MSEIDVEVSEFIDKYRSKYGDSFFIDRIELEDGASQYVVLTNRLKDELTSRLVGKSIKVNSVESGIGDEFVVPSGAHLNVFSRKNDSIEYLADQLIEGETLKMYPKGTDDWFPVMVNHDFMAQAPVELGWVKYDAGLLQKMTQQSGQKKDYSKKELTELLSKFLSKNSGIKYTLGGKTAETGIDCSGLVQITMRELTNLWLPRLSSWQALTGEEVDRENLKIGDIAYFEDIEVGRIGHVGIVSDIGRSKVFITHSTRFWDGIVEQDIDEVAPEKMKSKLMGFRRI